MIRHHLSSCLLSSLSKYNAFGISYTFVWGFPGGSVTKNPPVNAGDVGSILGSGRSPRGGNGNLPTPRFLPGEPHGQRSLPGQGSENCRVTQLNDRVHRRTHMRTFTQDKVWSSASSTHITWELDRMQDLGPRPPPLKESLPSNQGPRLLLHSLRFEKPCTTPFHDSTFIYYKLFS